MNNVEEDERIMSIDAVNRATQALGLGLAGMTQDRWDRLTREEKADIVDLGGLSPQLIGYEGCRVEVVTGTGDKRRFWVNQSSGWRPCHIEIARRNSRGGDPADRHYQSVRVVYAAYGWRK